MSCHRSYNFRGYYTTPEIFDHGWVKTDTWWRERDFIMATGKVVRHQGQDWHEWLHVRHKVLIWLLPVHLEAFYQV